MKNTPFYPVAGGRVPKVQWADKSGNGNNLTGVRPSQTPQPQPWTALSPEEIDKLDEDLRKLGLEPPTVTTSWAGEPCLVWPRKLTDQEVKTVIWYMCRRFDVPEKAVTEMSAVVNLPLSSPT